ncbi:glycosyltransferase family 2 protein [Mariniluteicoccus flavus]
MEPSDITVVVPAHDEEDWLGACLASVSRAAAGVRVPVRVVVVLDGCTDQTAARVHGGVTTVVVDHRNVGAARAAGFAAVPVGEATWFATTDADSRVPETWLAAQLAAARDHDVVVGTVRVDDWSGRGPEVGQAHDRAYAARDGHRHVHGANLGLSAQAYARLGGFAPLPVHEDADLVARADAAGLRIAWSGAAPVVTSARVSHRTPDGFSATLDRLETAGGERI